MTPFATSWKNFHISKVLSHCFRFGNVSSPTFTARLFFRSNSTFSFQVRFSSIVKLHLIKSSKCPPSQYCCKIKTYGTFIFLLSANLGVGKKIEFRSSSSPISNQTWLYLIKLFSLAPVVDNSYKINTSFKTCCKNSSCPPMLILLTAYVPKTILFKIWLTL